MEEKISSADNIPTVVDTVKFIYGYAEVFSVENSGLKKLLIDEVSCFRTAEAKTADSDDSEYQMVFAALDELKLALKPFFKRHLLEDGMLSFMKSEEELRNVLTKELGLPFGQAFKFSRHWFNKYKETASSTKSSGDDNQNVQAEEVLPEGKTFSKNLQDENDGGSLKESQDSAEKDKALISSDVKGTRDSVALDKIKTQQCGKEGLTCSSPVILDGILLEEGLASGGQNVAHGNSNDDNQNVHLSASKGSQQKNPEEKRAIPTGNNDVFTTTTTTTIEQENQKEDGRACETQQDTHIDRKTESPNKTPNSRKDKGTKSSKKKPKREGKAQSNTENKRSSKGAVQTDSIQGDDNSFESAEHEGSTGDSILRNNPSSDIDSNSVAEKTNGSNTVCVASQSTEGTKIKEPNQSVEKVSSSMGCTKIDNGSFSGPIPASSSIPQTGGLPANLQKDGAKKQSLSSEGLDVQHAEVSKCTGRPFGIKAAETNVSYQKSFILDAEESKEVEYKSFSSAHPSILPWKIMEKAKKFICACLNADSKGIIYFGVGDNQEQGSKFHHGEVIGLEVENIKDDITKALQFLLDNHIKSDDGPLQKGGEQNCINIHFVPVTCQENRANLYVVEIEVSRDWRFCKDNVYHCKSWIEKQVGSKDFTGKKGLNDLFKVKDVFDDVAVRTKGASTCVKQHEVKRQVREPLETKYKQWKREKRFDASELTDGCNPDDADLNMFSSTVRDRLRDLNFIDNAYILVANKVPPQHRGTPQLSFLQNIPWVAVFDLFDAASKKDGLHFICNEMTDAPRASIKTLDDFKDISADWITDKESPLSTRGTTWILQLEDMQDKDWITSSAKDCFYRALSAYKQCFPSGRLVVVILGLGENAVMEMSDITESCFSILGGEIARKCVTIISETKTVSDAFISASKLTLRRQLKDCSITNISWKLLKEVVREMVGPTEFEERDATTKLPYFSSQKEILNKVIHSWHDLEVYCPEPRLSIASSTEDIEKARDAFYKGAQASQINLFHNHSIPRTLEEGIIQKIEQTVKSLGKPSSDRSCYVKTVIVPYEPGSGVTTLCRRVLWNKRKDYRCAVIKAITKATDFQIDQLQGIGYDDKRPNYSPPVLVLADNFPEVDTLRLSERLITRETKCVLITTYPVETTGTKINFEIKPLRQLDENEMSLAKDILINITRDIGRRRDAEEVLEREKRFIWFGLELFGRDYVKIEERLQNHVKSTLAFLGDSHAIHEKLLYFCCFLHYYSNGADILPHPFAVDLLYEASDETGEQSALTAHIHDKFGGLLLEECNETYGYHGWRPAHSLVSEVVKTRMKVEEIAVQLLENAEKGKAYVNKFLRKQLFQIFLHRKRVSNLVNLPQEDTPEDNIDSDIETDVQECYEVRTRYSPLILDVLGGDDGARRTLELMITICQKANQTKEKAYAWQQLARFMGYEVRFKQLESKDVLHNRLFDAINVQTPGEPERHMPETGIQAAHIAVDIAIRLERDYSHHYTTKGVLYVLQLRDVNTEDGRSLVSSMPDVIDIGRKALEVYDQAIQRKHALNFYSVIGKVQVMVLLLKIVKALPWFCLENERFTRYLEVGEIPGEMQERFQQEDINFFQNLGRTTLELLNNLFKDVRSSQLTTSNKKKIRDFSSAIARACKLRRQFYDITGFDRSKLVDMQGPLNLLPNEAPDLLQQAVQDILFKNNETPYSGWSKLDNEMVMSIYRLLKPLCQQGYGNHDDMLIFARACLRLRGQEKPTVEELDNVVQVWVQKCPDSEWPHLFNYMIHFPIPNGSLAAYNSGTLASMKKCWNIIRTRTGWRARKSGAEYFLGKGTGLTAIVSRQEFPELEKKLKTKTDFWRSKVVSETLLRVRGQKDTNGVITYHRIQLRFDDTLYPNESKDALWFYVGFSVTGPYAFDPIDEDTYSILTRKLEEQNMPVIVAGASNASGSSVRGLASPVRQQSGQLKGRIQRNPGVARDTVSKLDRLPNGRQLQEEGPISLSVSNLNDQIPNEPLDMAGGLGSLSHCTRSTPFVTQSPPACADNLHSLAVASPDSYASALRHGEASQDRQTVKAHSQISEVSTSQRESVWPSIKGTQGKKRLLFQSRQVDGKGRLHHGARVLTSFKYRECRIHTSASSHLHDIDLCTFAHSWKGDTLQSVCAKCTEDNKRVCKQDVKHKEFIYDLGPYCNEDGTIWTDSGQATK